MISRSVTELLERRRGPAFHHVVLGCGPAGLSTAIHLQRAGYRVLAIDCAPVLPAGAAWSNQRWLHSRGEFYLFSLPDIDAALAYAADLRHGATELKKWARSYRINERRGRPAVALARTQADLLEIQSRQRAFGIEPRVYSEFDLREVLPIRRGVFVGGVETADTPVNPRRMYQALVERFVSAGGVVWLSAELQGAEDGFALVRPSGQGVREYRSEGVKLLTWAENEISFAHRLIYACGYGVSSLAQQHFPEPFNLANPIRTFAATKLFGRLASRVSVAYVADPWRLHRAGFALVEHADGCATLCSTQETLNVKDHLINPRDFETVVAQGEQALRDLCEADLTVNKESLGRFIAQRCTKVDIQSRTDQSRSRSNTLLAPSDWQLLALAGKATLAPLLGRDVAAFARAHHPDRRMLSTSFPFIARMPSRSELPSEPISPEGNGTGG